MYKSNDEVVRAVIVFAGLMIGQLFIYGGRIRDKKPITWTEVYADILQYGVKYVACMATLLLIESFGMYKIVWSKLMYCILFTMSFDKWFTKLREKFLARMGMVSDALMGKLPTDAMMEVPKGTGETPAEVKATFLDRKFVDALSDDRNGEGVDNRVQVSRSAATGKTLKVHPVRRDAKSAMAGESLRKVYTATPTSPKDQVFNDLIKKVDDAAPDDI